MNISIVPMSPEHLDQIYQIECRAHQFPWKESIIRSIDSRGACHHTLLIDGRVGGYFYAQNIVGEVTLLNIALDPVWHGQGFGRQLLDFFLAFCERQSAESVWLEVRESNLPAYTLYLNSGFNEVDRRLGYYPTENGREDAIIMSYFL
ncbi:ribosomal protein S18-alanine N-acetyltransferase [Vibrio mangrovi]|uniref:[Ribosomal protein bS18]-alanine N-acetyltransferase n=1 Tax=Vibrio mangrovi TaxID=474394 RepID=A0A1Y6IUJ3_9VIBR|nr:ribosomal protein S18-alanine N-acetyltransferase [Vibrio mangrovi]MDW6003083.1 ribosomal protein S18-alanine N-acetyltransferase [Vibrio mangrovi]SMS01325.1 ribosomal-protein-alanine N-acetyltransferase [Vibrio mangrovi]